MTNKLASKKRIATECWSSIKKCSKDTSQGENEYLVNNDYRVIDFDKLKELFCKECLNTNSMGVVKSVDCYLELDNDEIILIEFKNGKITDAIQGDLKVKLKDSLLILLEAFDKSLVDTRKNVIYMVVYNKSKNKLTNEVFKRQMAKNAGKKFVRYGLSKFSNTVVKEVVTITQNEFQKYWKEKIEKKVRRIENYKY